MEKRLQFPQVAPTTLMPDVVLWSKEAKKNHSDQIDNPVERSL